jgi:hypothetical protein
MEAQKMKLKLFKGYHTDFGYSHEKVVIGFFESAHEVERRLVEINLEEYRGYINDMEFGDIRDEYAGLIERINNLDDIYEICCKKDIQKHWKMESLPFSYDVLKEGYKVYSCLGKEIDDETDIQVCIAKDLESAKDTFAFMLDKDSPHMREWIDDTAINMSGAEEAGFWDDEEGYMFELDYEVRIRKDIVEMFGGDRKRINQYLDEHAEANIRRFFSRDEVLCNEYLIKMFEDKDFEFTSPHMYLYWWRFHYLNDYMISEIAIPSVKEVALV